MRYALNFLVKIIFSVLITTISVFAENVVEKKIIIDIDYTQGLSFQKPAGKIVIGNPIIADINIDNDQFIFISGKSPGRTNMLVYGADGKISEKYILVVRDPNTYLTLYQGTTGKSHFDCEPRCQRVLRIEDSGEAAGSQREKISSQLEMIDGRATQASSNEKRELDSQ